MIGANMPTDSQKKKDGWLKTSMEVVALEAFD
jgi:hypothetical protein